MKTKIKAGVDRGHWYLNGDKIILLDLNYHPVEEVEQ
jgi:hypothetical protein